MSREEYELLKQMNSMQRRVGRCGDNHCSENEELIIEENTIYEIDLECYECLLREKKRLLSKEGRKNPMRRY